MNLTDECRITNLRFHSCEAFFFAGKTYLIKIFPLPKIFYFHPMSFISYNGKTVAADTPLIIAANRGLRYGDGIFETMKLHKGKLILADDHFARLWKGLQLLKFDIPKLWSPEKFEAEIVFLATKNKLQHARVRLMMMRAEGGLYDAKNNTPNYVIETTSLPESSGALNENGLQLCIHRDAVKPIDAYSNLKHNNCLPYVTGAIFAKEQQCNDALILNSVGNIIESTIANLFYFKDGMLFTPALSEGCVAGVMRKWLVEKLRIEGYEVKESRVSETDLMSADEVFLSNSIYNLRWVREINNKQFTLSTSLRMWQTLREKYVLDFV